jgi:hypothetical protein
VNGQKSPLNVFNMVYFSALFIFIFYGLQVGPGLSKYPQNMTSFHRIPKTYINLIAKWVENCYKSCGLNVLKA